MEAGAETVRAATTKRPLHEQILNNASGIAIDGQTAGRNWKVIHSVSHVSWGVGSEPNDRSERWTWGKESTVIEALAAAAKEIAQRIKAAKERQNKAGRTY